MIGVLFVGERLYSYANQINFSHFYFYTYIIVGVLSIFYGASNILLARAWWHLLYFLGAEVDWKWAAKTYGLSQLAKYIPGNIFHIAGRQSIGMSAGVGAIALAKSSVWELGLIAISGSLYVILVVPMIWPKLSISASFISFIAVLIFLFSFLKNFFSSSIIYAVASQIIFLTISSAIFIGTLFITSSTSDLVSNLAPLCGAYVIAWLSGLITPGAPAGVGVREMVLLFLLGNQFGQADLLLAVVLGRTITVLGDFLYFVVSIIFIKS